MTPLAWCMGETVFGNIRHLSVRAHTKKIAWCKSLVLRIALDECGAMSP